MTVILAVRCAGGLVLATDSQATAHSSDGAPIKIDAEKVDTIGSHLLFAGAGAQGCTQRIKQLLYERLDSLGADKPAVELAAEIHEVANAVQKASLGSFVQHGAHAEPERWGGIFCGWASDGPFIMEVEFNGGWQFHEEAAAAGSGFQFAMLAQASVQHYNVPAQSLEAAKAIAYRSIETTCSVSAFGVGLPVQIGVVDVQGARRLSPEESDELNDVVNLWKAQEVESLGSVLTPLQPAVTAVRDRAGLDPPS